MRTEICSLIVLLLAAATSAATAATTTVDQTSSFVRRRRVPQVDDRVRGDGFNPDNNNNDSTAAAPVDDRERGDGFTGYATEDDAAEENPLTSFPTPSGGPDSVLVVVTPSEEPTLSPSAVDTSFPTPSSPISSLVIVTPQPSGVLTTDEVAAAPTREPTMPQLFEDPQWNLCDLPVVGAICEAELCKNVKIPVVDKVCLWLTGGSDAEADSDGSVAEDAAATAPTDSSAPSSNVPSAPPISNAPAPSSSPSTALATREPSSAPTKAPSSVPTPAPTEVLECPVHGYEPYTIPELELPEEKNIFEYLQEPYSVVDQHRAWVVRDNCVYAELAIDGTEINFVTPKGWLDSAVKHFEGVSVFNGAEFSGITVPQASDILINRAGVTDWSVMMDPSVVTGDKPMFWHHLPSEQRAQDFKAFLVAIIETAPVAFLSNAELRCGSGPFCNAVGNRNDICYMDPVTTLLHVDWRNTATRQLESAAFSDALEWFTVCAAALQCARVDNNSNEFLYVNQPDMTKQDLIFSFVGNAVSGGASIQYQCANERQSYELYHFARAAARDPRSPLAVGRKAEV